METRIHATAAFMVIIYLAAFVYGVCNYDSVQVAQSQQSEIAAVRR
jgi:hypothetical protein